MNRPSNNPTIKLTDQERILKIVNHSLSPEDEPYLLFDPFWEGNKVIDWTESLTAGINIIVKGPWGLKFTFPYDCDSPIYPYMLDFMINDCIGAPHELNKKEQKAANATKEFLLIHITKNYTDSIIYNHKYSFTIARAESSFWDFYHGYLSALTGKIE